MKAQRFMLVAGLVLIGGWGAVAGTISYVPIASTQSDASSGIAGQNQYTAAISGGSAPATGLAVNGVAFTPLPAAGQPSLAANNIGVNALSGTLNNFQAAAQPPVDGSVAQVFSSGIVNEGAADNSQQEIVLDPASLTPGATYDLRIYVANSGTNQNREVNLAFVGDGQPPTETGFFNEEDARTTQGGFRDPNQPYYINYHFTWDGQSTPGATATQRSGQAPFVLYALTNQPAVENAAPTAPPPAPAQAAPPAAPAITTAQMTASVEDKVGVTSDTFYSNEALNKHGRWVEIKKYGRAWQPNDYPSDWRPYARGHFVYSDDGGYTWVADQSENEWGWATYHYGRWCRVHGVGCGWAWVPGTAWSGAWVSWRQGGERENELLGWAPLPPEASLRVNVGISRWADREYDIGPDYYTFVRMRDFGADNYWNPAIVVDRRRYPELIGNTVNITNINYTSMNGNVSSVSVTQVRAYNGGPDFNFINTQIRLKGGREIPRVRIDRVGTFTGGPGSRFQNNTLTVFTPQVVAQPQPRVVPKVAATIPDNKIDHGWTGVNPKVAATVKNQIAQQTQGQTPMTTKAVLPPQVLQAAAAPSATPVAAAPLPSAPAAAVASATAPAPTVANQMAAGTPAAVASPSGGAVTALHPGEKVQATPATAAAATGLSPAAVASPTAAAATALHPGQKAPALPAAGAAATGALPPGAAPAGAAVSSALSAEEAAQSPAAKMLRPGQPLPSRPMQSPAVATSGALPSAGAAQPPAARALHPGEKLSSPNPAASASVAAQAAAATAPPKPAVVASPSVPALHPGAKITSSPAQSVSRAVTGASAVPSMAASQPPVIRPTPARSEAESRANATPPSSPPPIATAPARPASTPVVRAQPSAPAPAIPQQQGQAAEQQKLRQQQAEQQREQVQQEQKQKQQQADQRQQQEAEQKQRAVQQQQAQQKEQQQAAQKTRQEQQQSEKQQQLKQQQAEKQQQVREQQKEQQQAAQKARQEQQQSEKQQQLKQQQAEQRQQQAKEQQKEQQQAAQKARQEQQQSEKQQQLKEQQVEKQQQLRQQQAEQRQQQAKEQQAQQKEQQLREQQSERQQQQRQQQMQEQAQQQRQQQLRQQQLQQQQSEQRQQQQQQQQRSQQQNRPRATPTPSE